jgi:hypothetical protein
LDERNTLGLAFAKDGESGSQKGGRNKMVKTDRESGQSILIIALVVMVLLALVALVVDVGNAYAHRRMVQNAVDAAALAGARMLAFRGSTEPLQPVSHNEVWVAVKTYAELNGLVQDDVRPELVLADGTRIALLTDAYSEVPRETVGVWVEGDLPFNTYFAHLLGFPTMQVTADAAAYHITGPCNRDDCIFPIIVSDTLFADEPGDAPVIGKTYVLWQQTLVAPGSFGWIYWVDEYGTMRGDPPQGPEVTSLEPNLIDNCRSGAWASGDKVHGDVGVNFQPVLDILDDYVTSGITVTIPFYSEVEQEGNNGLFTISGFGVFELLCAHSSRAHYSESCEDPDVLDELEALGFPLPHKDNNKYLVGRFQKGYFPEGFEDGCVDTGVSGVSLRPPKSLWMPEWREDE